MRAEVDGAQPTPHSSLPSTSKRPLRPDSYTDTRSGPAIDSEEDHQNQWAHEEQQMMIQEQDRTIDTISGTLSTLAQQAGLMGQEIVEHNE